MKKIATLCCLFLCFLSFGQDELYVSESSKFKVFFPGEPFNQSQKVPTEAGELTINLFMVQGTEEMYMVSENSYPEGLIDASDKSIAENTLKGAIKGAFDNMAAQSGTESKIESQELFMFKDKYQGIKSKGVAGMFHIVNFGIIYENRMYLVMCLGMNKYPTSEESKKFLESFDIIE